MLKFLLYVVYLFIYYSICLPQSSQDHLCSHHTCDTRQAYIKLRIPLALGTYEAAESSSRSVFLGMPNSSA